MINKTIEIIIDSQGNATIEGKNFTGKECDASMKLFEDGMGKVKERKNKPEYHRKVQQKQKVGG